ncbi:hypothetical protein [Parvularcula sp. IMCC14364]|uniref:hypothetical protein n=1 Tax=Parvularcula sp. IMCC14364 TaxID=3067902 RepID=UPI0027422BA3|nr:hypothetical protein [Parvularcula sp. IMCC14364]
MSLSGALARDTKVISGETQVVANIAGREVTINELRTEMQRLGLSPVEPGAERRAFESLRDRILLVRDAEANRIDRRPEALWRIEAAKEQALVDVYLNIISQPPEPSQAEVRDYILQNPTLFARAKNYTFQVLELPTAEFNADMMTPLFDEKANFAVFRENLEQAGITYMLSESVRQAASFPEPVRIQLDAYDVHDNIVIQGDVRTSVMKITKIIPNGLSTAESLPLARALLKQSDSQKRIKSRLEQLRKDTPIAVYHSSVKSEEHVTGESK